MAGVGSSQFLIWDTDLDSDCDDISATALLAGFLRSGDATLLAATVASENAYAAAAMQAILAHVGVGDTPVGAYQGAAIGGPTTSLYTQQLASEYGSGALRSTFPSAVSILRQALADAPDGSVKIVTGGTLTNIAALLRSPGDDISPLTGMQLVASKVTSINSMGGNFISPTAPENNIRFDISAANYVASNSPVDVYWSGHEVGNTVKTTVRIEGTVDTPFERGWSLSASQLTDGERPSWDLTGLYHAVKGLENLFAIGGANGTLSFDANSYTHYTPQSGGRNYYLSKVATDATIADALNAAIGEGLKGVNRPPTGSLAIEGVLVEDAILAAISSLNDPDGLGTLSFQWMRNGSAIEGARSRAYTLGQSDVGNSISVKATYVDARGNAETVTSQLSAQIQNVNDLPTGQVIVSGVPSVGAVLTASNTLVDEDGIGPISYQWLRNGTVIAGATSRTYTLQTSDTGTGISVRATYTDLQGTNEVKLSAATGPVIDSTAPVYTGTTAADTFQASSSADWTINGLQGDDTLVGLSGSDKFFGAEGNDSLTGGSGNDFLDGGTGADQMRGNAGNDIFVVDNLNDRAVELASEGTDTVQSWLTNYTLGENLEKLIYLGSAQASLNGNGLNNDITGARENDTLSGLSGNDVLRGMDGADHLDGGFGNDAMFGGLGNDMYVVDSTSDLVIERSGEGIDTLETTVSFTLPAFVENLTLVGTGNINGTGNSSSNRLVANHGRNSLSGGGGADLFVFGGSEGNYTTGRNGSSRDRIIDFQQGLDKIDLSAIDASVVSWVDQLDNDAFASVSYGTAFSRDTAGQLRFYHEFRDGSWVTVVQGNTDADSKHEFQVELMGRYELSSNDFVF